MKYINRQNAGPKTQRLVDMSQWCKSSIDAHVQKKKGLTFQTVSKS